MRYSWHTWFEGIKLQLSGDIVTNLQYQIEMLREKHEEDFSNLRNLIAMIQNKQANVTVTVKSSTGTLVPNMPITNLFDANGNVVKTNANGVASGVASAQNGFSANISPTSYLDIASVSSPALNLIAGESYSTTVTITTKAFWSTQTSQSIKFSPLVKKISYSLVGGGGGGGNSSSNGLSSGGGGGGGGVTIIENSTVEPYTAYSISIGAGGSGLSSSSSSTKASSGGTTTFMNQTAKGGAGGGSGSESHPSSDIWIGSAGAGGAAGTGGGNGGKGFWRNNSGSSGSGAENGNAGTTTYYTGIDTLSKNGPGGGGGGVWINVSNNSAAFGGSLNGGNGEMYTSNSGGSPIITNAVAGTLGGGGGGAWYLSGASGGKGYIGIRMYF